MADEFRYDPTKYRERVSLIAQHVVPSDGAIATIAPQGSAAASDHQDAAVTTRDKVGRRVNVIVRDGRV